MAEHYIYNLILICVYLATDAFGKDGVRIEFYDDIGNVKNLASPMSTDKLLGLPTRHKRFTPRPGHATNTHSCDHVRGVPNELRSASIMQPHGLATFYQKYTEAYGIPIVSSQNVHDDALKRACYLTRFLLADHYGVRDSFYQRSGRTAVIGEHEGTTSIPEHSYLDAWWNQRARGLGATDAIPVSSGGEENLLCHKNDRYPNEDIFLHEFAHAVANIGAFHVISGFQTRLENQYNSAKHTGLWANTYSMTSSAEYFAEGVQSYFDVNDYSNPPNGIHGPINTRDKLRTYDPALFQLIEEVYPCHNTYLKRCESNRAVENGQNLRINCVGGSGSTESGSTSTGSGVDGGCIDNHPNCHDWAAHGECSNNPGYMLVNCMKSCNHCTSSGTTSCVDNNQFCADWASSGECSKNPGYMLTNCKKSCHQC